MIFDRRCGLLNGMEGLENDDEVLTRWKGAPNGRCNRGVLGGRIFGDAKLCMSRTAWGCEALSARQPLPASSESSSCSNKSNSPSVFLLLASHFIGLYENLPSCDALSKPVHIYNDDGLRFATIDVDAGLAKKGSFSFKVAEAAEVG